MKRRRSTEIGSVTVEGFGDLERIGSGGFSVVYRARQLSMNREVAIKVLNAGFATDAERRTFERECHALGQLSHHPNIVTVFNDAVTTDGRPCIVMELYRTTYRQRLSESGPVPVDEALSTGVRIAGALQVAHDQGVLHRDIKPHNIFISHYGEPALGDFGISTLDDERSHSGASGLSVAYAAPEILEDAKAEISSDVYSLAATLYHLVAGSSPFASTELRTTVRRILTEPPATIDRDDCPSGLSRVLVRTMSKDPADRPASAHELAEMLREVQARAGFERTPIPMVPGVRPPAPPSAGGRRATAGEMLARQPPKGSAAEARPAAPSVEPRVPDAEPLDNPSSGAPTVARARAAPPAPAPIDAPPDNRRRAVVAICGVVAAALLLVGGVLAFGGGGDDGTSTSTISVEPPDVVPPLAAPQNVAVLPATGGFNVHFELPDSATGGVIEILTAPRDGEEITVRSSPRLVRIDARSLCVRVVAVGDAGRRGGASDTICSS